jgi:hypothetical protein
MKPYKTVKIIGYNEDNRRSLNEIIEQSINPVCSFDRGHSRIANENFDRKQEEINKFNIALTYL